VEFKEFDLNANAPIAKYIKDLENENMLLKAAYDKLRNRLPIRIARKLRNITRDFLANFKKPNK